MGRDRRYDDVEKLFYQDVRDKKRTGTGAFAKKGKGSEKAGVAGGVKFPKNNFKRYEKNSKVENIKLFDTVININDFNKYNQNQQIKLLLEWRKRYSNTYICDKMDIGTVRYKDIIDQLNIEEIEQEEDYIMSPEELEKAKESVIPYHEFQLLPKEQQYELLVAYTSKMKNIELSKLWENKLSPQSISTKKSALRREFEKEKEQPFTNQVTESPTDYKLNDETDLLLGLSETNTSKKQTDIDINHVIENTDLNPEDDVIDLDKDEQNNNTFNLNWSGTFTGKDLSEKLKSLAVVFDDSKDLYDVKIMIKSTKQ